MPLLARVLLATALLAWVVAEARRALRRRPGATHADRGSLLVLGGGTLVGFAAAVLVARTVDVGTIDETVATWLALVLVCCGALLRGWGARALGQNFTYTVQTSPDQAVVTTGPYRWVRHPAYLGMMLVLLGVGALLGSGPALVALLVPMTAGVVVRIRVEESAMSDALGRAYRDYAEGRKRLVPLVW